MLTRAHDRSIFFFFNDTATTEIYTLSLHDALPISGTPGPVYIEYPAQVIQEELDVGPALPPSAYRLVNQTAGADKIAEAVTFIGAAKQPILLVGHGVHTSRAGEAVKALADATASPAIPTSAGTSDI